jgi:hypothetical protein
MLKTTKKLRYKLQTTNYKLRCKLRYTANRRVRREEKVASSVVVSSSPAFLDRVFVAGAFVAASWLPSLLLSVLGCLATGRRSLCCCSAGIFVVVFDVVVVVLVLHSPGCAGGWVGRPGGGGGGGGNGK